jgi:hypothetical protein
VRRGVAVTTDRRVEASNSNKTDGLLDRVTREWIEAGLDVLFFGGGGFVERFFDGLPTDLVVLGGDVVGTVATVGDGTGGAELLSGRGRGIGRSTLLRLFLSRNVLDDRVFICKRSVYGQTYEFNKYCTTIS